MSAYIKKLFRVAVFLIPVFRVVGQSTYTILPGKGMAEHDFLITGEWDHRKEVQTIFIVRGGKMIWSYEVPFKEPSGDMAELGDATMRQNGNIVFSRKTGASEITPAKKIIWNYDAPSGTEIHSIQPLDDDRVLMVINGVPAIAKIINVLTGKTEREIVIPTGKKGAHLQFRRVRMTSKGTLIAAHLDSNVVAEYTMKGENTWTVTASKPWDVSRLNNGHTLITATGSHAVTEVDGNGKTVWELTQKDLPELKLFQMQTAVRLKNGNTVISNWCVNGIKKSEEWLGSVQYFEVTSDKKLVWALSQWYDPDLGPGSSMQILDDPKGYLQYYP